MPLATRTIFSDASLQGAIDEAVKKIPDGKNSAIVAHADGDGASVSVVVRAGDHWTIDAACIKPWQGPVTYGADVIYSW